MKLLTTYIKEQNEKKLNESAAMVAAAVASSVAFNNSRHSSSHSSSHGDSKGLIDILFDKIEDKRKRKIVAQAFQKLENDQDIENLVNNLDKKYIEKIKASSKNYTGWKEEDVQKQIQNIIDERNINSILDNESKKELIELIRSKLNKKEIQYIDEIFNEIKKSQGKKYKDTYED